MSWKVSILVIFAYSLLLSACTPLSKTELIPIQKEISFDAFDSVEIDVFTGTVTLLNGNANEVILEGVSAQPESIVINQKDGVLEITSTSEDKNDSLLIYLPASSSFELFTFSAALDIQGSFGTANIRSSSGEVSVHDFEGDGIIWAGRGSVHINGGEGSIVIISEHGNQLVERFKGNVRLTSIMGNLQYFGTINDENEVELEVDHGSVKVDLPASAQHQVEVTSTSGNVTCVGKDLVQTVSGCEGRMGAGTGTLAVRTVSGNVNLWVTNSVEGEDE
jgi:DUF4097 and DUF4098 domain-containing protein YvlB